MAFLQLVREKHIQCYDIELGKDMPNNDGHVLVEFM